MKKRTSSLPVLIIAVLALVLGSVGTATAVGLTKGQVKRIAAKVVKKKAPGLSVAFAANAGNATLLNGQLAGAYQDRAVYTSTTGLTSVAMPSGVQTELRPPVSLTMGPGANFVNVSGGAGYYAANSQTATWYAIDATCAVNVGFGYDHRVQGSGLPTGENVSFNVLQPLAPGSTHTFRLCGVSVGAAGTAYGSQLLVETVALNGLGGTTKPADQSRPAGQSATP